MRVAQIIDNLYIGGAQKIQIILAEAIREHDVPLTVLSLESGSRSTFIPGDLQSLGVDVTFYPSNGGGVLNPKRIWRIARFLRREGFDVVHTHLTYANIIGALAGRLAGIPVVTTLHNSRLDKRGRYIIRQTLETWVLRYLAHRVMAVGDATAQAHQKRLRGKHIEVIPNAITAIPSISQAERSAVRTEIVNDPSRPLLLSVGRINLQKGYSDLLTAFAHLRQKHPNAALAIAGRGGLHDELTAQIKTLGLEGHAMLLGPRDDVPRLLAASDIFVSSSLWEGLPIAILEAMAAGLPIVATNVSDVPRVVVDGTGLLVPPQEPTQLSEAVCSLLDDPALRQSFGTAARTHITHHHSAAKWIKEILTMYESVQKNSKKKVKVAV